MMLRNLNLYRAHSIEDIKNRVAKRASGGPPDNWVLGRGWDQEKLRERRYPEKLDLDEATSKPVFLQRVCGHVAVANSSALSISGIDRNTSDPEGGVIVKDAKGEPTGVLKERAIDLVQRRIRRNDDEARSAVVSASKRLTRLGLTSLHCIIEDAQEYRTLKNLKDDGRIPQSIYAIMPANLIDHLISSGFSTEKGGDAIRIGGVKVYLDGSLGARTAALRDPYSDAPDSSGMLTLTRDQLHKLAIKAGKAGFQLCIHAIGDRAVETAIEELDEVFGPKHCRRLRHRIEHSSLVSPRLIAKMRKLGVVASVQPRFIYSDSWAYDRLGSTRTRWLYPFSSMIGAGIPLAAGSDCPVEDPDPLEGVWSAVARPGLDSSERLDVGQAISSYTTGASFASFSEDSRGTLDAGKVADMVVLDKDPFKSEPGDLRNIRVVSTIIGGEVVT
jgi:predicted amidohydrolase YtcJ